MEHSKNYDKVKMYYNTNRWSLSMLKRAINKWITIEEFKEITNINFE